MLEKLIGQKIELLPKVPKDNEKLCNICGGTGWLYEKGRGFIEKCHNCYNGVLQLCEICHEPVRGMCMNEDCRNHWEAERENRLLSKAIITSYDDVPNEYKEMMYSDSYPYNEGCFTDIEELIEYCNDEDIPLPEYVWSTQKIPLSIDASSIIESACEELHEDAYENITDEDELQELLDNWCDKQSGVDSYSVNYKYAIRIDSQ